MLHPLFYFCLGFLALKMTSQWAAVRKYLKLIRTPTTLGDDDVLPKAAILLSVRGGESSLEQTLTGLLNQDYPNYEVHVVIDSEFDPGWEMARSVLSSEQTKRLNIHVLQDPLSTCTLKCSSLLQAFESLEDDVRILAFVDSDIVPKTNWLRALASPIVLDEALVTSGQRWYQPQPGNSAGFSRAIWNGGAVVAMEVSNIPWGGSMAMCRDFMNRQQILERWSEAFTEDAVFGKALKAEGKTVRFVPEVSLIDDSEVSWPSYYRFARRQMFNTRQEAFWMILTSIILISSSTQWILLFATLSALVTQKFALAAILGGGWLFHLIFMAGVWLWHERGIRAHCHPELENHWSWGTAITGTLSTLMYLLPASAIASAFVKFEEWRGIRYDVRSGPWKPKMLSYHPFGFKTEMKF